MTEEILNGLKDSIETSLKQLAKTNDINERQLISETVKALSNSLVSFIETAEMMDDLDFSGLDFDEDLLDDEEDTSDFFR